ncbi:MAG: PHP domain-containing protein [bacterium]|nr:PHP domain-containing protein [bacterium]
MMLLPTSYRDRILSFEQSEENVRQGYAPADLHVHSSCSHDVLPFPDFHPEAIYQEALKKDFAYITITDHDTMEAYDIIGWDRERLVTGVEITLRDPIRVGHTIHVNVYELNKKQFEELRSIAVFDQNIETFISFLRDQNLPYTYNHPFWFVTHDKPNYRAVEEIIELFPVIEYNMKRVRRKNLMALWLAAKYGKGIIASTDTHIGQLGRAYTLSKGDTFREYFQNIADCNAFIVPQDLTLKNLNYEIATWIEVLFNLDETTPGATRYTGIGVVDRFINFCAANTYEDYPRVFPIMERCFQELARTGLFSLLYLSSQNHKARKIRKLLEIPDLA